MKSLSLVPVFTALAAAQIVINVENGTAPTAPGGGTIHQVMVGPPANAQAGVPETSQLQFMPNSVSAAKGDVVRFNFMAANQSVTQTTFDAPCTPMTGGAVSGLNQNSASGSTFDVSVQDTAPMFMTAGAASDCAAGMVFVVNPAADTGSESDQTVQNFLSKAISLSNKAAAAGSAIDPLVAAGAVAQSSAGETVTISVEGAAATGAATGTSVVAGSSSATVAAAGAATTVAGQGTTGSGQACGCTCLCGTNALPAGAGVGEFGGFQGQMAMSPANAAAAPAAVGSMAPAPMRRVRH